MNNIFGNSIPGPKGDSAYKVAVRKGYKGTEEEWLLSLIGSDSTIPGPPGVAGDTGPQGSIGPKGDPGRTGDQGEPGRNAIPTAVITIKGDKGDSGIDGKQGVDGRPGYVPIKGVDYFDGTPGKDGSIGPQGPPGVAADVVGLSTQFASISHTHSNLYSPIGNSTAYQTDTLSSALMPITYSSGWNSSVLSTKFLTTAMPSDYGSNFLPIGNSTQFATGTLSSALMPLSYSSGFQTATLSSTFAQTGHTHSNLYLPLGNSTQFATGTLSSALMPLSYSSGFQTATLSSTFAQTANVMATGERANYFYISNNTFLPSANSTQWATATLSSALMPLGYSSQFQTATLSGTFAQTGHTHSDLYPAIANTTAYNTSVLSNTLMHTSYSSAWNTSVLSTKFITAVGGVNTLSEWAPYDVTNVITNNSSIFGNSSVYFVPFDVPLPLYADRINFFNSVAFTTSALSTITWTASIMAGIYTRAGGVNSSVMSSIWSGEVYVGASAAATSYSIIHPSGTKAGPLVNYSTYNIGTADSSQTAYGRDSVSGARAWQIPIQSSLTAGHYWLGYGIKTTHGTGTASWNFRQSYHFQTGSHIAYVDWGQLSRATNYASANAPMAGFGSYRAQTAAMPGSVILNGSDIKFMTNVVIPAFNFSGYGTNASNI
jgi:hypothetical protein